MSILNTLSIGFLGYILLMISDIIIIYIICRKTIKEECKKWTLEEIHNILKKEVGFFYELSFLPLFNIFPLIVVSIYPIAYFIVFLIDNIKELIWNKIKNIKIK